MKKIILVAAALILCCAEANCQNILKDAGKNALEKAKAGLKKTVEETVTEVVDETANKVVNKATEATEKAADKVKGVFNKAESAVTDVVEKVDSTVNAAVAVVDSTVQNAADKVDSVSTNVKNAVDEVVAPVAAFIHPDFNAGTVVIFEDNLDGEKVGEFPSKWDLIGGEAVVADLGGAPAIDLSDPETKIAPLAEKAFGDVFTFEADLWFAGAGKTQEYSFEFLTPDRKSSFGFVLTTGGEDGAFCEAKWYAPGDSELRTSKSVVATDKFAAEGWNHLAMSFDKKVLKIYVNTERVANIPNCANASQVRMKNGAQTNPTYIKNVKIADVAAE